MRKLVGLAGLAVLIAMAAPANAEPNDEHQTKRRQNTARKTATPRNETVMQLPRHLISWGMEKRRIKVQEAADLAFVNLKVNETMQDVEEAVPLPNVLPQVRRLFLH